MLAKHLVSIEYTVNTCYPLIFLLLPIISEIALLSLEKGIGCICYPLPVNPCHPKPQWEETWNPEADSGGGNWIIHSITEVTSVYLPHLVLPVPGARAAEGSPGHRVLVGPLSQSSTSIQAHFFPDPLPVLPFPIHATTHTRPRRKGLFAQDVCLFSLDVSGEWQKWGSHLGIELFNTGGIVSWARWGYVFWGAAMPRPVVEQLGTESRRQEEQQEILWSKVCLGREQAGAKSGRGSDRRGLCWWHEPRTG